MSDKKTILIVDDDEALCELTRDILKQIGYHPVAVPDAEDALRAFYDNPHQFDLIVPDHLLSGIEGAELAAEFLRVRPDIPIALYTGAVVSLKEVRSKGVRALINKPLTRKEFAAAIARIFNDVS